MRPILFICIVANAAHAYPGDCKGADEALKRIDEQLAKNPPRADQVALEASRKNYLRTKQGCEQEAHERDQARAQNAEASKEARAYWEAAPADALNSCIQDSNGNHVLMRNGSIQATISDDTAATWLPQLKECVEAYQAAQKERQEVLGNPANLRAIYGAEVCNANAAKRDALAEIAKEKKYAKIGGMVNKKKLYDLQLTIRHADEQIVSIKKDMSTHVGISPSACTDKTVMALIECRNSGDGCQAPLDRLAGYVHPRSALEEADAE